MEPKKSVLKHVTYYKIRYRVHLHSDSLQEQDKQKINEYFTENSSQNVVDIAKYVQNTMLKDRDIFYSEIYKYVQKLNTLHQAKFKDRPKVNKTVEKVWQYIEQRSTMYKTTLSKILQQDYHDYTPKQICELILSLDKTLYEQFWIEVSTTQPKFNVKVHKTYFNGIFKGVMYSYQLNEEDLKYIDSFQKQNSSLTYAEITKLLMESYFIDKNVFYWKVYNAVKVKMKGKIEVENIVEKPKLRTHQKNALNTRKQLTQIYSQVLKETFKINLTEESVEQQIISNINQLDQRQGGLFWELISKQLDDKPVLRLKQYFQQQYCQIINTNHLTDDDKQYIKQFVHINKTLSVQNSLIKLKNDYFNERNINKSEIYAFVHSIHIKLNKNQ
ncbi:Hypothetical_protein [Hexamita inflata]|uniref:Hypothetical_protein n=1 Tax=Hexamita inflata TaxID=28002 RepID=A0AA86PNM2_9EUKA|nr:Hypothetical protein HINF_LOCUS29546 [Hexamita inflata]